MKLQTETVRKFLLETVASHFNSIVLHFCTLPESFLLLLVVVVDSLVARVGYEAKSGDMRQLPRRFPRNYEKRIEPTAVAYPVRKGGEVSSFHTHSSSFPCFHVKSF
jgi:hypothetical protein